MRQQQRNIGILRAVLQTIHPADLISSVEAVTEYADKEWKEDEKRLRMAHDTLKSLQSRGDFDKQLLDVGNLLITCVNHLWPLWETSKRCLSDSEEKLAAAAREALDELQRIITGLGFDFGSDDLIIDMDPAGCFVKKAP